MKDGIERPLRDDETNAIDRELDYASTVRDAGCTTVRHFTLTLTADGRQIARTVFTDESCGSDHDLLVAFKHE